MFGVMFNTPKPNPYEPQKTEYPKCSCCGDDWHGIPNNTCQGSFKK